VPLEGLSKEDQEIVRAQKESIQQDRLPAKLASTGKTLAKLEVKYSGMKHPETQDFSASMAIWVNDSLLVLLFRNYDAPLTSYSTPPPPGRAAVILPIRKYKVVESMARSIETVTPGTYTTAGGVLVPDRIHFGEANLLGHKDHPGLELELGAIWRVNTEGRVSLCLFHDSKQAPPFLEMINMLLRLGTVELTSVGREPGSRVVGELDLGKEKGTYTARGKFDLPVVQTPSDYKGFSEFQDVK